MSRIIPHGLEVRQRACRGIVSAVVERTRRRGPSGPSGLQDRAPLDATMPTQRTHDLGNPSGAARSEPLPIRPRPGLVRSPRARSNEPIPNASPINGIRAGGRATIAARDGPQTRPARWRDEAPRRSTTSITWSHEIEIPLRDRGRGARGLRRRRGGRRWTGGRDEHLLELVVERIDVEQLLVERLLVEQLFFFLVVELRRGVQRGHLHGAVRVLRRRLREPGQRHPALRGLRHEVRRAPAVLRSRQVRRAALHLAPALRARSDVLRRGVLQGG